MANQTKKVVVATKDVTVTYTVEEAIKIAEYFDMMLDNLSYNVAKGGRGKSLLDDAMSVNLLIARLRTLVYDVTLGE